MSKIQFAELQETKSELNQLSSTETSAVVGGYNPYYRQIRNDIVNDIDIATIVQINNNINVQIAFNGDNFNVANLNNNAGAFQG
ncbi:MAG: hypothetical protein QNJ72_12400 [Pleurocapsa sp. MO_226.B13]|nr:hypothetical protein [Pleurocapsa sp. MO_226.B13]